MKPLKVLIIFFLCNSIMSSQTIITLQPGPTEGKDVKIWSNENTTNFGDDTELKANAWTWSGNAGNERALLQFDLSEIPQQSEICYAKLSLYSNSEASSQTNSQLSGTNETYLCRITSAWEEDIVTWDTQPTFTEVNQVTLPVSTADYEDILDIDVTELVTDMYNDPANSFGFMLKLVNEDFYRRRLFASSDTEDPTHYPKLEICYNSTIGIEDNSVLTLNIFPNPITQTINIKLNSLVMKRCEIRITDLQGKILHTQYYNTFSSGSELITIGEEVTAKIMGCAIVSIISDQIQINKFVTKL